MRSAQNRFTRKLLAWYDKNRRDLPWRVPRGAAPNCTPNPYHVFVSETMLQQTQVATVIPYFRRFLEDFPTIAALARSDEQEVLRLWQGLGYYSRARNLLRAAQAIVADHGCELPANLKQLLALPGIGRYTAGAIASIAFGIRASVLDGNVARVLCRLDRIESDPRERETREQLWRRAEEILPKKRVGDFNSALMEIGAMVCTPRNPQCLICPVREFCEAFKASVQNHIPAPRKSRPTPLVKRCTFCIRRNDRWLIEQRPPTGRWAGMWQFVTIAPSNGESLEHLVRATHGLCLGRARHCGTIRHSLTHRRYEFDVFIARAAAGNSETGVWVRLNELRNYPLSRPQLRIAAMIADNDNRDF